MAYTPQTWANKPATSTPVTADRLTYIETGIQGAAATADAALPLAAAAELIRDTIGAALVAGAGVSIVVNDAGDTITINSTPSPGLAYSGTAWPTRGAGSDPVMWISTKHAAAPEPPTMAAGDMWVRHPDALELL